MTEYREREAATQAAIKEVWLGQTSTGRIAKAINDVPAADVIKVVRCEECNFFSMYALTGNGFCVHDDEGIYRGELGCAYESDPWSGLSYGIHHDGWGECLLRTDDTNGVTGGILFDTLQNARDAISKLSGVSEKEPSMAPPEFFFSESNTTTMKFKPVCERCGYTLPSLSFRGDTSSGYMREWHFHPFSCPRCGRRIVTAELPRVEAGEIDYTE